jgi:hypothetical protein
MTNYAARTPKYGRRAGKNDASTSFENRVFGLHVYCGPINGEILIHTDELVRGGANFMVEVQRRGMFLFLKIKLHSNVTCVHHTFSVLRYTTVLTELGNMLSTKYGMTMPREIHFQWDNCGENKVNSY